MALILVFRNVSKLAAVSDYDYGVFVNEKQIAGGHVKGHQRKDGWPALVRQMLLELEGIREND